MVKEELDVFHKQRRLPVNEVVVSFDDVVFGIYEIQLGEFIEGKIE